MKKNISIILIIIIIGAAIGIYQYNYGKYIVLNPDDGVYTEAERYIDSCNYESNDRGIAPDENMIESEETALEIGKALLKEHFSDSYNNIKNDIVVREEDGNWVVYNEIKVSRSYLKKYSHKGGVLYVKFSKKSGEVLRVGVED